MQQLKFSLITPEHSAKNAPYLMELYESLCAQTYDNWEWILFLNNGCGEEDIPYAIKNDIRVRGYVSADNNPNIGAVKKEAFSLGNGDVLVELDHDDMLTPDCLEELNLAFQDETVGFVYSDNAVLHMKDEFVPYDSSYGWTYRTYNWKGKDLIAMNSFDPTSHSLSYIWYAPDHVRAWRKSVYDGIGGHNSELSICDDHELCIRTFLATKMVRIPKVLYIYRITGDNTWIARNAAIQEKTKELFLQYARALAEKDAQNKGLLKVDIGAGINPMPGYLSVDLREDAHIKYDLNEGLPFGDSTVGVLNASHVLEHLKDPIKSMREIHRVLAHGGWAFIEVPSTDGRGAFQDPTHVSFWNENSFLYYTDFGLGRYIGNTDIRFQEFYKATYFPNEWQRSMNICVTSAWLVANKDNAQRLPHLLKI